MNDAQLTNLIGTVFGIPLFILLVIFVLWLYFNAGMLARLTDIRYKLEDIEDLMKQNLSLDRGDGEAEDTTEAVDNRLSRGINKRTTILIYGVAALLVLGFAFIIMMVLSRS